MLYIRRRATALSGFRLTRTAVSASRHPSICSPALSELSSNSLPEPSAAASQIPFTGTSAPGPKLSDSKYRIDVPSGDQDGEKSCPSSCETFWIFRLTISYTYTSALGPSSAPTKATFLPSGDQAYDGALRIAWIALASGSVSCKMRSVTL